MHAISLFISHSWKYSQHYDTLASWIFQEPWQFADVPIQFTDMSVPKDDPIHTGGSDAVLKQQIFSRIYNSHVIVVPTGMYSHFSKWIQKEIDGSAEFGKPILAVNPWGQEKKAGVVLSAANEFCGWNKQSVINSIWKLATS